MGFWIPGLGTGRRKEKGDPPCQESVKERTDALPEKSAGQRGIGTM